MQDSGLFVISGVCLQYDLINIIINICFYFIPNLSFYFDIFCHTNLSVQGILTLHNYR